MGATNILYIDLPFKHRPERIGLLPNYGCKSVPYPFFLQGKGYDCNRCAGDIRYCMPYVKGDILEFQFLFQPPAGVNGWSGNGNPTPHLIVSILDGNGATIFSGNLEDISPSFSYGNAASGLMVQNLQIDPSLINTDCFSLKIEVVVAVTPAIVTQTYISEKYCLEAECSTKSSILTAVNFCGDEWGRTTEELDYLFYSYNPSVFTPKLRVPIEIVDDGIKTVNQTFSENNVLLYKEERHEYVMYYTDLFPPFFATMVQVLLSGGSVNISGRDYFVGEQNLKRSGDTKVFFGSTVLYDSINNNCNSC